MGAATFSDAAAKVDAAGSGYIAGTSKLVDYNTADIAGTKNRLAELRLRMTVYDVAAFPADAAAQQKLFSFAKALGVETIVGALGTASAADLDKLATDNGVKAALAGSAAGTFAGRSMNIGAAVETPEQVNASRDRVLVAVLKNSATVPQLVAALNSLEPAVKVAWPPACADCAGPMVPVKNVSIVLSPASVDAFTKAVQPLEGARIIEISKSTPITSGDTVPVLDRLMINATTERLTVAPPRKARKLLVIDLCPQGGFYHRSIAHGNYWIEQAAKKTNAFAPTFSNDLENLKYPKIKEYDAVFLNDVVGPAFADPAVTEGLTRFVREGGGVAAIHGSTYASQDVAAIGEMLGGTSGPHRIELSYLKVEDSNSPITKQFSGSDYGSIDEHYHFPDSSPYTREKLHVLLSVDNARSDMHEWKGTRKDDDYAMAWIRSYGQGRVFTTILGHTVQLYGTPELSQMMFAGTQFALGDLDADTTPSARLKK
jgi:type 1 glutamine amidotransferase